MSSLEWIGRKRRGFTLVEILIVVVVLGILAAMVIPQFSAASEDAMESQLRSNIRLIRSQIMLYQVEHNGRLPHLNEQGKLSHALVMDRLLSKTDAKGAIAAAGKYGPYLNKWPANPFAEDGVATQIMPGRTPGPLRNGKTGWYYCTATGVVSANSTTGALDLDPDKPGS